jgi:hypothetical protein
MAMSQMIYSKHMGIPRDIDAWKEFDERLQSRMNHANGQCLSRKYVQKERRDRLGLLE